MNNQALSFLKFVTVIHLVFAIYFYSEPNIFPSDNPDIFYSFSNIIDSDFIRGLEHRIWHKNT